MSIGRGSSAPDGVSARNRIGQSVGTYGSLIVFAGKAVATPDDPVRDTGKTREPVSVLRSSGAYTHVGVSTRIARQRNTHAAVVVITIARPVIFSGVPSGARKDKGCASLTSPFGRPLNGTCTVGPTRKSLSGLDVKAMNDASRSISGASPGKASDSVSVGANAERSTTGIPYAA